MHTPGVGRRTRGGRFRPAVQLRASVPRSWPRTGRALRNSVISSECNLSRTTPRRTERVCDPDHLEQPRIFSDSPCSDPPLQFRTLRFETPHDECFRDGLLAERLLVGAQRRQFGEQRVGARDEVLGQFFAPGTSRIDLVDKSAGTDRNVRCVRPGIESASRLTWISERSERAELKPTHVHMRSAASATSTKRA